MTLNPNLIFYTCVATGTMVLAEFNSRDADMATLALKCLEKTPKHHTIYTHTVHDRTHTFLIDSSFVYFAIYDKSIQYPIALSYLKSVRDAFETIHINSDSFHGHNFSSHCFQGEFSPVFHQLLASNACSETPFSPRVSKSGNLSLKKVGKRFGSMPLLSGAALANNLKKKKRCSSVDDRDYLIENKVDFSDRDLCLSTPRNGGMNENSSLGASWRAKRVWKRHVWVILALDLAICLILIGVWLYICKGFKCIHI